MNNEPKVVSLEKDKEYYFCTCGKSDDGIFCNGAHKGTNKLPKLFTVNQSKDYYLCGCKNSSNVQFCDGSHTQ